MKHRFKWAGALVALALALPLALTSCGSTDNDGAAKSADLHTLTDMDGREVEVPRDVKRVVTLGAVPVINGFLFALGEGDTVVNGLPEFALDGRWKYQYVFAPAIEKQEQTQTPDGAPMVEKLIELQPDVVLTMSPEMVEPLEDVGLTVMVLEWEDSTDVKKVVALLGDLLDQKARAAAYTTYFDDATTRVGDIVAQVPESERRSALYMSYASMTRPHPIADWWISQAGGRSVTEGSTEDSLPLNVEQIIKWNPDVIFVSSPDEVELLAKDKRFATLDAVVNAEVYPVPIAAHTWGNRTSEQPLTVFFAASKLYPDLVTSEDLLSEVDTFYTSIFQTDLTDDQVSEIASGQM